MNCQNPSCAVRLNWFRDRILHRPGYYLESGWYCSEGCLEKGVARRLEKRSHNREKPAPASFQLKLEHILIGNGAITRQGLDQALSEPFAGERERLSHRLLTLGLVKERDVTLALSKLFNIPVITLNDRNIPPGVLNMIPVEIVRRHGFFPLDFQTAERRLVLITHDPAAVPVMVNLRGILDCQIAIYLGDESMVRAMIEQYSRLSGDLKSGDTSDTPCDTGDPVDVARCIVGRAKKIEARSLKVDCFDDFIWTRFVVGHKPLDLVLTAA
jgi:hypothetical protein